MRSNEKHEKVNSPTWWWTSSPSGDYTHSRRRVVKPHQLAPFSFFFLKQFFIYFILSLVSAVSVRPSVYIYIRTYTLVLFDLTYQISQLVARESLVSSFVSPLFSSEFPCSKKSENKWSSCTHLCVCVLPLGRYIAHPPADRVKHGLFDCQCELVCLCVERGFFNVFRIRSVIHTHGSLSHLLLPQLFNDPPT